MNLPRAALAIFIMRVSNIGLTMIGPIFLVRLLSVEDFGTYREFLVYSSVLLPISSFCFTQGLLYFIPAYPAHTWRFVRQTVILTAISSILAAAIVWTADVMASGSILGQFGKYVVVYTLLSANVDFWEYFWLSQHRTTAAFAYTSGRLAVRLITVLLTAIITRDVISIIKWLILLETARLVASLVFWRLLVKPEGVIDRNFWTLQRAYCLPLGAAQILGTFNQYIGNILIARTIGAAGLAQYSIGTYAVPILYDMRNSVSFALLPRLARESGGNSESPPLALWHRSNALFAVLLVPVGVLLARYAELVVVTVFSAKYLPAVAVFQVYLLSLLNHTIDFGVALRLLGINGTFVRGSIIGTAMNLALLFLLLPKFGIMGAIIALMIDQFVVFGYFAITVARKTGTRVSTVLGLQTLFRVIVAAIVPLPLLLLPTPNDLAGILLAGVSTTVYVAAYLLILWRFGSEEVRTMLRDARRLLGDLRAKGYSRSRP